MASFKRDIVGFFEEPTTYRHDFNRNLFAPKSIKKITKTQHSSGLEASNHHPDLPKTMMSYDTLQKLDYKQRLAFDAMLKPKEIIGTNPKDNFCQRIIKDEGLTEAIRTRPRLYVSPAISLDDVKDHETRKLMVDFTYMTTSSKAGNETWAGFKEKELCLPDSVFEENVDPVSLRLNLLPDIPAGFQSAAKKWDKIQERYQISSAPSEFSKSGKDLSDSKKCSSESLTPEEKRSITSLMRKGKLRLPYDKLPLSYGGFRPQFAIDVPLEIKESSNLDPNLSVAKAINSRL